MNMLYYFGRSCVVAMNTLAVMILLAQTVQADQWPVTSDCLCPGCGATGTACPVTVGVGAICVMRSGMSEKRSM